MSSWVSCDRALDLCKSNADRSRGGCFFWFVLNKRSIGDETALCLPKINHFDLVKIRPSIGFWYDAFPNMANTHPKVYQINVSGGGLPKQPVPKAYISIQEVAGDRRQSAQYLGRLSGVHGGCAYCPYHRVPEP